MSPSSVCVRIMMGCHFQGDQVETKRSGGKSIFFSER